jgi:hypothetical protein
LKRVKYDGKNEGIFLTKQKTKEDKRVTKEREME